MPKLLLFSADNHTVIRDAVTTIVRSQASAAIGLKLPRVAIGRFSCALQILQCGTRASISAKRSSRQAFRALTSVHVINLT